MRTIDAIPATTSARFRARDVALFATAAIILTIAAITGFKAQRSLWEITEPIRFRFDITNAYEQGRLADSHGLLDTYDHVARGARIRSDGVAEYGLDYPPLRLTVACYWYRWTRQQFPNAGDWQNTWDFNLPLLIMNRLYLAMAAISAGLLVHMARRWRTAALTQPCEDPPISTGVILGPIAAALVWLSPSANLLAFGWPQWDICVPAFFLAALYAGFRNCWLLAGVLLSVGAMFKGQLIVGVPVMVLWPIASGRWTGIVRLLLGMAAGGGLIAAPFLFHNDTAAVRPEIIWFAAALMMPWCLGIARRFSRLPLRWWIVPAALVISLCSIAGWIAARHGGALAGIIASIAMMILANRLRWRYQLSVLATALAVVTWTCAFFAPSSWNWLRIGFLYGTEHFQAMYMGNPSNLAAILQSNFGIHQPNMVAFTLPASLNPFGQGEWAISWRILLRTILFTCTILCGVAMGIHFRRRNPLFLLAATASWLAFVTVPAQIHERYLLYPALVSTTLLALGIGWTFMYVAIGLIAILPILHGMLAGSGRGSWLVSEFGEGFGQRLFNHIQATHPGIGWALIALTLVSLWKMLDLRRRQPLSQA